MDLGQSWAGRAWFRWSLAAAVGAGLLAGAGCQAQAGLSQVSQGSPVSRASPPASSPALKRIRARGEVVVGVRNDFPPFAMVDAKGRMRGLEVDLAQALADRWGVRLRLVAVTPEDRFHRLGEGAVDLIIASAGDTAQRRLGATAVEPHYYGSGVGVLLRPGQAVTHWSHLRGHTLCAVQGAAFNAPLARRHQLRLHAVPSVSEALRALEQGLCAGLLYSEAAVHHLRSLPAWRAYLAPLDPAWVVPWAISIGRGEQGTEMERAVGDAVAAWHRDGTLIALEKKWGLQPSRFLQSARARWSERRLDGSWVCARDAQGLWPVACRDPLFVPAQEAQGVLAAAVWLRDAWGVRWAPDGEAFDSRRYLQSLVLTVLLAGAALAGVLLLARRGVRAWRTLRRASQRAKPPRTAAPRPLRMPLSRGMLGSLAMPAAPPARAGRRLRPRPLRPRRRAGTRRLIRP